MRRFSLFLASLLFVTLAQESYSQQIEPYLKFLRSPHMTAKDYVISLFTDHDIVILCERIHTEFTQYELFTDIIADQRFIDSVGNVFTEIGSISQSSAINNLLLGPDLPASSVDNAVVDFQRNCSIWPLWSNSNLAFLIHRVYELNKKLPFEKKVRLYPSDVPLDWRTMDTTQLQQFWKTAGSRDSIIASQIIERFDAIVRSPMGRKKALVIMNYRHAFGNRWEYPVGKKSGNVGRFLFDRYGARVANVYVNGLAITEKENLGIIQNGKWDASFDLAGIENLGFDFSDSPFGDDQFDIWPYKDHPFTYKDVFNGFAFYLPLQKHKIAYGFPGLVDSTFAQELVRRTLMYQSVPNMKMNMSTDWPVLQGFNTKREFNLPYLDSLSAQIKRWHN